MSTQNTNSSNILVAENMSKYNQFAKQKALFYNVLLRKEVKNGN
nr:hypothetical protein [uncultured Flavobacterium sp.]